MPIIMARALVVREFIANEMGGTCLKEGVWQGWLRFGCFEAACLALQNRPKKNAKKRMNF
jgi:hypothetical protein